MSVARRVLPQVARASLGVALLAAVIGALAMAHGVRGWQIPGTGTIVAPADPPTAGLCLGPRDSDHEMADPRIDPDPVSCDQPHSAEVFSVGTIPGQAYPLAATDSPSQAPALAAALRTCHDDARRYLGEFDDAARWRVPPQLYIKVMVPTPLAWSVGQHWFGCQAAATRGPAVISFTGTMRGAFSSAEPPAVLASCGQTVGSGRVPCTSAHRAEELSVTRAPNRLEALTGVGSAPMPPCPQIAARLIGTSDPTFGGRLAVIEHAEPLERSCWISTTDGTTLVGTVIGHGSGPLTPG